MNRDEVPKPLLGRPSIFYGRLALGLGLAGLALNIVIVLVNLTIGAQPSQAHQVALPLLLLSTVGSYSASTFLLLYSRRKEKLEHDSGYTVHRSSRPDLPLVDVASGEMLRDPSESMPTKSEIERRRDEFRTQRGAHPPI